MTKETKHTPVDILYKHFIEDESIPATKALETALATICSSGDFARDNEFCDLITSAVCSEQEVAYRAGFADAVKVLLTR